MVKIGREKVRRGGTHPQHTARRTDHLVPHTRTYVAAPGKPRSLHDDSFER